MKYYVQSMSFEGDSWYTWRHDNGQKLTVFDLPDARKFARDILASGADVVRLMPDEPDGVSLSDKRVEYYKADRSYDWLEEPPSATPDAQVLFNGDTLVLLSTTERFKEEQALAKSRGNFSMTDWRGREYSSPLTNEQIERLFEQAAIHSISNAWYDGFKIVYPQRVGRTKYWRFFIINTQEGLQEWTADFANLLGLTWSVEKGARVGTNLDGIVKHLRQRLGDDVQIKDVLSW